MVLDSRAENLNNVSANYGKWSADLYKFDYDKFSDELNQISDGVYTISLGKVSVDILLQGFHDKSALDIDHCLVVFGGALTRRDEPPFFSGVSLSKEIGIPLISISDPSLSLSDDLMLSWYAGNYLEPMLPEKISVILDIFFKKIKLKPILMGGSGGGFSSLLQTGLLETKVITLVWNPQIDIKEYHSNHVLKYLRICFPEFAEEISLVVNSSEKEKKSVVDKVAVKINLPKINELDFKNNTILYLQNVNDLFHINNHYLKFIKKFTNIRRLNINSFYSGNFFYTHVGNWGRGHSAPPKNILINILSSIINNKDMYDVVNNIPFSSDDNSSYIPMFNLSNEKSGVDISYKVIRNNEYDEILVDLGTLSNVEYAIYFINNKSEKNVTWYQSSPIFKVPKGNIVKVHIFVRDIFKNVIHKLLPYQISENALLDTVSLRNRSFSLFTYIIGGDFKKLKDNGWKPREDIDLISINYPIHWDHSDDNTAFNLHAWRFMSSSWASYSQDPSFKNTKEIVDFNINIVNDWFVNHGRFNSKFSWYDMAVAFRAFHLSFLKFIITNYKLELSVHLSKMIDDLIDQHIIWLSNKDNIGYGNHALYQFISLKTLEFVLGRNDNDEFCYNAMRDFIEYSFDENSINNENSPFYHEYNLQILKNINSDIFPELKNEIDKIICKGTLVTKWLTAPNKEFYRIGDTEGNGVLLEDKDLKDSQILNINNDSYVFNDFLSSGYQIVRSHPNISFSSSCALIFYGTNKSNIHRHCDGLSFIYYHNGLEVFADAGKYTYERGLSRMWVVSDKAHNTVGLEGKPIRYVELGNIKFNPLKYENEKFIFEGSERKVDLFSINREIQFLPNKMITIIDSIDNNTEFNTELSFLIGEDFSIHVEGEDTYIYDRLNEKVVFRMSFNQTPLKIIKIKRESGKAFVSKKYNVRIPTDQILLVFPSHMKKIITYIDLAASK